MSGQADGTVKWYNPEKAYGFITTADGHDLFVHRNALSDGRPWLVDGQEVVFTVRAGLKGSEAADVQVVRDVEAIPAARQRLYAGGGRDNYGGDVPQAAPRPFRAPYVGPIPSGAVPVTVLRVDPAGRFLFAHAASLGADVYVHGSLFGADRLRPGDEIAITIERSERGLRARTVSRA